MKAIKGEAPPRGKESFGGPVPGSLRNRGEAKFSRETEKRGESRREEGANNYEVPLQCSCSILHAGLISSLGLDAALTQGHGFYILFYVLGVV